MIIVVSVAAAMALTLQYPAPATPFVIAVYQHAAGSAGSHPVQVTLAFEGIDARKVRLTIAGDSALGDVLVLSNQLRDCVPFVGSLQALSPRPFEGGSSPSAVDADGRAAGTVAGLSAQIDTNTSRQDCELADRARRFDFSTYGMEVLAGYRFLELNGTQYVPPSRWTQPVQAYFVRLDDAAQGPRFEGGLAVADRPNARQLNAGASALSVRWMDPSLADVREFALFILAGAFALGISMLIELAKPRFLEE